ncbi:MAG: vanadium-dependent haloperoxidase [Paracoccaceae bacterium]
MSVNRQQGAYAARQAAADLARSRTHPEHHANGDEQVYAGAHYAMSFTKGLKHDPKTGLVDNPDHFEAFREAIDTGFIDAFTNRVPVPSDKPRRKWEAPTAGTAYDLQGPDCQAVTMAPAPALCSDELAFEMAEVYELALVRDEPFECFDEKGMQSAALQQSIDRMNGYAYAQSGFDVRPRKNEGGALTVQTAFRGSSPGVEAGPYLSQFMLIGNTALEGGGAVTDGQIGYGALQISQKVAEAEPVDFMTEWKDWLHVQNGFDVNGIAGDAGQIFSGNRRFIHTPRDLATYVHYDALYEAYLNACLMLLGMGTPFDPGFDNLSGMRNSFPLSVGHEGVAPNAGGFALYGGPHILTLVCEVATRALKAARYQKFNLHIRARPEVLAARIEKAHDLEQHFPHFCGCLKDLKEGIAPTVDEIIAANASNTALLPMAFREGSPMHPAYAAGHATVAGACVTVLKAFFDTSAILASVDGNAPAFVKPEKHADITPCAFVSIENGTELKNETPHCPLTLEGELNKLAANISIGRNMAGVHYFSDYYDSLRMGEEIAIGLLQEQALCYPTDPVVMSLRTFDGQGVRIGAR